jgi:hypothetical protein
VELRHKVVQFLSKLFEQCLNWLLWIPCLAHVFKVLLFVNCCDAAMREKSVIKHVSGRGVSKTNKVMVENFNAHRFYYRDDLLF